MRTIMYTPAETMAAAWIMALTGVGPSMASGSQVCSGNCALLPMVPMISSTLTSAATLPPKRIASFSASIFSMSSL